MGKKFRYVRTTKRYEARRDATGSGWRVLDTDTGELVGFTMPEQWAQEDADRRNREELRRR